MLSFVLFPYNFHWLISASCTAIPLVSINVLTIINHVMHTHSKYIDVTYINTLTIFEMCRLLKNCQLFGQRTTGLQFRILNILEVLGQTLQNTSKQSVLT